MRKLRFALGAAILAAGLSPGAFGLEAPLKFERSPAFAGSSSPFGGGNCPTRSIKPPGNWKLPKFTSDKPLYALLKLGDRNHLLILDQAKAGDKLPTRLWFDRNGDGDLTDEKPFDGAVKEEGGDGYFNGEFPLVDATITVDGSRMPYCLKPMVFGQIPNQRPVTIIYEVMCAFSGTFSVGGKRYTFRLSDCNGNGRFTDHPGPVDLRNPSVSNPSYTETDIIYLTDGRETDFVDGLDLGDFLLVRDKLFEMQIDMARRKAILTEVKTGLAPLKLSSLPERLSLYIAGGKSCLMAYQPAGDVIQLPSGACRLIEYQFLRKDAQGDLWRLQAQGTGASARVSALPDSGTALIFGEPFDTVITLRSPAGSITILGDVLFGFEMKGRGKEEVSDLTRLEGNATQIPLSKTKGRENRPAEPTYVIVKPDGEIVAKGSFEYG